MDLECIDEVERGQSVGMERKDGDYAELEFYPKRRVRPPLYIVLFFV